MEPVQEPDDIKHYKPREDEREKASHVYLMSVMAVMAGLPLPIINLLAVVLFFLLNRKSTYYVRWHCTQALVSQLTIFIINSIAFTWTVKAFTGSAVLSNRYFAYIICILVINITEVIVNIRASIKLGKGIHTEWWLWGTMTRLLMSKKNIKPAV